MDFIGPYIYKWWLLQGDPFPLLLIWDASFIFTPIHTSFIYWEYFCLPKQTESFSNKYNLAKIHAHMTRLLIWFKWRECCFQYFQSWSCPVTSHTAYSTYTTYSKLFQPLQFFFPVLSSCVLLCLSTSCLPMFLLFYCPPVFLCSSQAWFSLIPVSHQPH